MKTVVSQITLKDRNNKAYKINNISQILNCNQINIYDLETKIDTLLEFNVTCMNSDNY